MKVYRLSKKKYSTELNGKGAAKFGNRWNSKGVEIIYTAQSRALAMAEVAVHLSLGTLPSNYVMIEIDIPDTIAIKELELDKLTDGWNNHPHTNHTQELGDDFIDQATHGVLKVPSAVVPGDSNYLIHPNHKDLKKIKISAVTDFIFDERLFQ